MESELKIEKQQHVKCYPHSWVSIAFFLSFFSSVESFAKVYPWVNIHEEDIAITENGRVEAETRLQLIRRAEKSLDIIIYDQRVDASVGQPLLNAIREAADRGVRVRYMVSWVGAFIKDPYNLARKFLQNPPTKVPVEYVIVGGYSMWKRGWGLLDGIHEKLLIIDNRLAVVTDRGHDGDYLRLMDTCVLFKGKPVQQATEAFEALWATVYREMHNKKFVAEIDAVEHNNQMGILRKFRDSVSMPNISSFFGAPPSSVPLEDEWPEIIKIVNWAESPALSLDESTFGPFMSMRLLHYDALEQLRKLSIAERKSPVRFTWKVRQEKLVDPVIEELIALSKTAKDYRYFTLSTMMVTRFKNAILERLDAGLPTEIFTNGKASHAGFAPFNIPVGWYAALSDLNQLLSAGATVHGLVYSADRFPAFLHRKVAVMDNRVIFGSHNFNIASSVESDEMSFEVEGGYLTTYMRELFNRDARLLSVPFSADEVRKNYSNSAFERWISSFFIGLY